MKSLYTMLKDKNYPEDGGSKILRNRGKKLQINTVSYPKRL